jgi:hypothetical protein
MCDMAAAGRACSAAGCASAVGTEICLDPDFDSSSISAPRGAPGSSAAPCG